MDPTKKFDDRAADYAASRPSYPLPLIECLYHRYGLTSASVIADIGSGTGKFAKHLLDRGSTVYCVEPNEDMRRTAERELGKYAQFHSVAGRAEHTTLEADFADHITVAQAFHWFDVHPFKRECLRLMKKGGNVFLIWNTREEASPLNQESHQVYSRYCPDFKGFSGGITREDGRIQAFFANGYERLTFENPLYFDRTRFISRSLSSSYSLKEGMPGYEGYLEALNTVFDKYARNGVLTMEHQTNAYIGTLS